MTEHASEHDEATILLVDDNPQNLKVLYETLKDRGYRLLIANEGDKALTLAERHHPEVILLDIMMPGMNGFETSLRVRTGFPDRACAIIYVTARQGEEDLRGGVAAGGNDFVLKPINREKLLSRIEKWIGRVHTIKTAV